MDSRRAVIRTERDATGWGWRSQLTVTDFPRTGWGHRGYDEEAVDAFVGRMGEELAAADDQVADLRAEVDRLHRYIRRQWAAVAAAEAAGGSGSDVSRVTSPAAQARAVLTQAQEIAERRLADAEARLAETERIALVRLADTERRVTARISEADELATRRIREADAAAGERMERTDAVADDVLAQARAEARRRRLRAQDDANRLLLAARSRYEDVLRHAHQRAETAAGAALEALDAPDGGEQDTLEIKTAYLRTFAKASRDALHAALDITGQEFDHLLATAALEAPTPTARVIALPTPLTETAS